ncbi:related to aflatoxin biosynthesis ketoreductase nor-1 [Rhynchosporium secalis]|uniref:Related to aflatoxin biosynthesis ketoreductase nor-1 n=1 Tax=Rhynchosporium secalis TaxID=38038 RepID=A0A1E1M8X7_RHYSE|nr:related to aflatoxin biosynthesis ketoreductase nor-1 [Rhynchosporium secalis]
MSQNIIWLITGANRGIGLALTASLLLRPNTTILATIRTPSTSTTSLLSLPVAQNSKLVILHLDFSSPSKNAEILSNFIHNLRDVHGIRHINTVIANAGTGTSFESAKDASLSSLTENWETNTLGPILLYQTLYPLLTVETEDEASEQAREKEEKGERRDRKFILISSSLGSIEAMEGGVPSLAYGISKAAANYFIRKVHFEEKRIVVLAVHPGWVKTANGQAFADSIGVESPPMGVEDSARGVLEQIDRGTKDTTSGSFLSYDGTVIPW